jgi:hypothetical protein
MRAKIKLPEGWSDRSAENPGGPPTYLRDLSSVPGPLQVSIAFYRGGVVPNPSGEDLQKMCEEFGAQHSLGDLIESDCGTCELGMFGTAVFESAEYPRFQLWRVSNGRDFITVTHICPKSPDPVEVAEAQEIVRALTLTDDAEPKWKAW